MRIVITTTLNDNLLHAKLIPILRARSDAEIVVVTDRPGRDVERVQWVWPRGVWAKLGRIGGRLPLLMREIWHPRTDLVMAYNILPHGMFAAAITRVRRVPLYLHLIGGPAELKFAHDRNVKDNRWVARSKHPERLERLASWSARRADKLFVPGSSTAAFLVSQGYEKSRIVRLHSTIDPERYHVTSGPRDIDVLVAAQLRGRKRPLFTLDVFASIIRRRPQTRFVWLGDGPLHDEFAAALDHLGLRDHVEWIETDDVGLYYKRAKVFLLCSINEGLSLACMEAMACGVVPVTSDSGDMSDIVCTGETGALLPLDASPEDFVSAVLSYLENPALCSQHSMAAHDLIEREHSFDSAIRAWQDLLEPFGRKVRR